MLRRLAAGAFTYCALVPILWLLSFAAVPVKAHDSGPGAWINQQGLRNSVGELCCGEGDCEVLPAAQVRVYANFYRIWIQSTRDGQPSLRMEDIPFSESQPSPDGVYWRCRRPDGSRRCFFAPPPNT
jgi:hypothetical protein